VIPGDDEEDDSYLTRFTQTMVDSLNTRMKGPDAQDQEEVARVIVNMAHMRREARKLVEVPFNIGTNRASQGVIEAVCVLFCCCSAVLLSFSDCDAHLSQSVTVCLHSLTHTT
jgi:hypothetical protein